jgi:hypothetical protein
MMGTVKIEGFVLNATGTGQIDASFLAARDMVTGQDDNGTTIRSKELKVRPIFLTVNQNLGISRMLPAKVNEFWRVRFTNGKRPDSSCSLKFMKVFVIPLSGSRGELDT